MAYCPPAISKASTEVGPASLKSPLPSVAELLRAMLPLALMWISCTASLPLAATMANASPPMAKVSTSSGEASR